MSIVAIYRIRQSKEDGYIAVECDRSFDSSESCRKYVETSKKRLRAYKYLGSDFGDDFEQFDGILIKYFMCIIIQSKVKFGSLIKQFDKDRTVNPISLKNVVIDLPYIYVNNGIGIRWMPYFDEGLEESSFNMDSEGVIIDYYYKRQISVLEYDESKHTPKNLEEHVIINTVTGLVTRDLCYVDGFEFITAHDEVIDGKFVRKKTNKLRIIGTKME